MLSEIINKSHKEAMIEIKNRGLEGLVCWNGNELIEERKAYSFNGKAERPSICWKSKPKYELDGIVRFDPNNDIGELGSGKNKGLMKSVFLYQLDENEKEIYICKVGGGFNDVDRKKYSDKSLYPIVFQVEFDSVISGTGALRFPIFIRERPDKSIKECRLDSRIKKAREMTEEKNEE